ncbi:hypothetical protein [Hydrogenophaga sp.]
MRFINDAVMGWDSLSKRLASPICVDPDVSRVASDAGSLLSALRHAPELFGWPERRRDAIAAELCPGHQVITDAADTFKHHKLRNSKRITKISVASVFLVEPGKGFRFIRNTLLLEHPELGQFDALLLTRDAIRFWLKHQNIDLAWPGIVFEGAEVFRDAALLTWIDGVQPAVYSARLITCGRDVDGSLVPRDFDDLRFAIVDDKTLLEAQAIPSSL